MEIKSFTRFFVGTEQYLKDTPVRIRELINSLCAELDRVIIKNQELEDENKAQVDIVTDLYNQLRKQEAENKKLREEKRKG